jgi:hypothetical protein
MPTAEVSANSKKVKILNPIENGSSITSRKRACALVDMKRAEFVGSNFIRFLNDDPRNKAAAERAARGYVLKSEVTKVEIAHIPLVSPAKAIREAATNRSRGGRHARGRSGRVHIIANLGKVAADWN